MGQRAESFDVVVVGAGPAGAVTAKRCAEAGLKTVILERKPLPREKVCSGLLFGREARELVRQEFGALPTEAILAHLAGAVLVVPGVGRETILSETPITWRRDLDSWMVGSARERGAEVRASARVVDVVIDGDRCRTVLAEGRARRELVSRFVVGADGPASIVRRRLFPELRVTYTTSTRECFEGWLHLDKEYSYVVFPRERYRPNFWINPKGPLFTVEGALRELKAEVGSFLAEAGFDGRRRLWSDGCVSRPVPLFEHLRTGRAAAAKGNAVLVGDAAALKIPLSGEGIGAALRSGILAARSIVESIRTGRRLEPVYTEKLTPMLKALGSSYELVERLEREKGLGFLKAVTRAFEASMRFSESSY
ncbi:MAG: FAD-dependent monooxygenase [Deltaproteobacteria bacterium]|nr:FAD-dependent monooxygenase [Deltaproteobacteria bacterium]